jgi:DNA (cytosine-5)-methyltransferase 1
VRFDLVSCLWKTARSLFPEDLPWSSVILPRWGMMRSGECWERNTPGLPTNDTDSGLWPTPTVTGNYNRKGASKNSGDGLATAVKHWPTPTCHDRKGKSGAKRGKGATGGPCLTMVVGGTLSPMWVEWLMGWPVGWTDCDVLGMDKFRQWFDSHGKR